MKIQYREFPGLVWGSYPTFLARLIVREQQNPLILFLGEYELGHKGLV